MAQFTERVRQAITLLQEERDEVRTHLVDLNKQVAGYIEAFDDASNEEIIAAARNDRRFYRTIAFPMRASASECLNAMKQWRERDLDAGVVRSRLYQLEKALKALEGEEDSE